MTLLQTIRAIETVAAKQPTVNSIVRNDVFRLNSIPDAKYGVFAWLQGEHSSSIDSSLQRFSFTFFFVDRLTFDKSNEIEIQSVGIETLENILNTLETIGIEADEYTFRTFNQRFSDDCAGVYCSVRLDVPKGTLCPEPFADYNNDFNDDFLIY